MNHSNGIIYEFFILCFKIASKLMRHRPHLKGREFLQSIPDLVIFTPTHDSYFEVPSLSKVYYALKPRPHFVVMAKKDFLSGYYLSSNFGRKNKIAYYLLYLLDRTGLPKAFFKKMKLIDIPRPFIEDFQNKDAMKSEISAQMAKLKESIYSGFSTLIFPEGTTWGFGGLKNLRSGIFQLVDSTYRHFQKKLYILPINVKVDRCIAGKKDIFINVGKPVFILDDKENFLKKVSHILKSLHTITFSQIASAYLQRVSMAFEEIDKAIALKKEEIASHLDAIINEFIELVKEGKLPNIDEYLNDNGYRHKKLKRFLKFCIKKGYIEKKNDFYIINTKKVLASFPIKSYRKENPVGFTANELLSIDYTSIVAIYQKYCNYTNTTALQVQ
ncbi:MAG: 1-acyl-sn-glycerol-3-phosphate acyltransferase [Spirochaetes bacterium]|nr:1-acyl-sn-glycerol-3-phosphate acyltransferase [Spirochaetota bacterium]